MLNEWVRNLPVETLQDIAAKARPGRIQALVNQELTRRRSTTIATAA